MKISIVVPSYNRAQHLQRLITSVLNQNYRNWELIIVDDGSTDDTKKNISNFQDDRIKYIYQDNSERSAARNNGIRSATGDWICFLDSDDEYAPEHLTNLVDFISKQNPSPGLICTGLIVKSDESIKKKPFLDLRNNTLTEIAEKFLIPTQVCVHRSILKKEHFDTRFRLWEDTHLWLRIAAQYPVYQIDKCTAIQHIHSAGTVVAGMKEVKINALVQYITAIKDLRENYSSLFRDKLPENYFSTYINSKYHMYLYQARQNKQLRVALLVWWKAMRHYPSRYLISEFPKIFINKLDIGIHGK